MSDIKPDRVEICAALGPRDGLQNEPGILSPRRARGCSPARRRRGARASRRSASCTPTACPRWPGGGGVAASGARGHRAVGPGAERARRERVPATGRGGELTVAVTDTFASATPACPRGGDRRLTAWPRARARTAGTAVTVTLGASFGCPFEGRVPTATVLAAAEAVHGFGPDEILLADTIGTGVPTQVTESSAACARSGRRSAATSTTPATRATRTRSPPSRPASRCWTHRSAGRAAARSRPGDREHRDRGPRLHAAGDGDRDGDRSRRAAGDRGVACRPARQGAAGPHVQGGRLPRGRRVTGAAIVTGGGGAIGGAACDGLAGRGFAVLVVDLDGAAAEAVAARIVAGRRHRVGLRRRRQRRGRGRRVRPCVRRAPRRAARVLQQRRGGGRHRADQRLPDRRLRPHHGDQRPRRLPRSQARHPGHARRRSIVNTASQAGIRGVAGLSAYSASKHAVVGLSRGAALEEAPAIRVNCLAPGPTDTRMMADIEQTVRDQGGDPSGFIDRIPAGRYGRPEEIAAAAVWLLADAPDSSTGAVVPVDGAMTTP